MIEFPFTPLPRWTILPGDPEPLKRWLRDKQAAAEQPPEQAPPTDIQPYHAEEENAA